MRPTDARLTICLQYYDSPCGRLVLGSIGDRLCLCDWNGKPCAEKNRRRLVRYLNADLREAPSDIIRRTREQLEAYFAGERTAFDIPLRPVGTDFQQRVWAVLLEIPYGQTRTYKDIALAVDNLKGIRAVAQAVGANGLSVLIPCHRVIGTDGTLTGFAGGLKAKQMLLALEGSRPAPDTSPTFF